MTYDWNKNRKRARFKAAWIGPDDDDGFVTPNGIYTVTEIMASGHYRFINNFGKEDIAAAKWFEVVQPPRLRLGYDG